MPSALSARRAASGRRSPAAAPAASTVITLLRCHHDARAIGLLLLHDGKALELGVAEVERLVGPGARVRLAKLLRLGPGLELRVRAPDGVRGIEHVVLALR